MLHSKTFNDMEQALRFANDYNNKIIPVGFFSLPTDSHPVNNRVALIYELVQIEEPGTNQIDLLKETLILFDKIKYNGYELSIEHENQMLTLKNKIKACLSSQ